MAAGISTLAPPLSTPKAGTTGSSGAGTATKRPFELDLMKTPNATSTKKRRVEEKGSLTDGLL